MRTIDHIIFKSMPGTLRDISFRARRNESNVAKKLRALKEAGKVEKQGKEWVWIGPHPVIPDTGDDVSTVERVMLDKIYQKAEEWTNDPSDPFNMNEEWTLEEMLQYVETKEHLLSSLKWICMFKKMIEMHLESQ